MKTCTQCQIEKETTEFYCGRGRLYAHCKACHYEYEKNNPNRKKTIARHVEKHRESINARHRLDYHSNLELSRKTNREKRARLRKANPEKDKAYNRAWKKKFWQENKHKPEVRLPRVLRSRFQRAILKSYKFTSVMNLIGCSIAELRTYLELKFLPGMTWDNYGQWHIDHIKPCASFNLALADEQRECFHFSNLQPLWAIDNIRKSNKFTLQ